MLTYNTMRFGTDEFTPYIKWALLDSKDLALDMANYTFIERFNIAGAEPVGTKRRFMFRVDDKVYTFDGQTPVEYTGEITVDDVLEYGNTAAQVESVKNFRAWGGKKIYPIIALYTEVEDVPSVKLSANFVSGDEVLDYEKTRKLLYQGYLHKILGFEYEPEIVGDASAQLLVAYSEQVGESLVWSDYMLPKAIIGKNVNSIRLKANLHVGAVNGVNSAKIGKIKVYFTRETDSIVCGEKAVLYTIRKVYYLPLKTVCVILKHGPVSSGAGFEVYYHVANILEYNILSSIGVGTGTSQTITLTSNKFFRAYNFHLFIDGVETQNYLLDTNRNTVTVTAPKDSNISATYTSAAHEENWIRIPRDITEQDISDDKYSSRYYAPINSPSADTPQLGVVKIVFNRPKEGRPTTVTREATGTLQYYKCTYTPDNIECDADEWEFDESTDTVAFSSPTGETVTITYSQQAPNVQLYGFTVGWSV